MANDKGSVADEQGEEGGQHGEELLAQEPSARDKRDGDRDWTENVEVEEGETFDIKNNYDINDNNNTNTNDNINTTINNNNNTTNNTTNNTNNSPISSNNEDYRAPRHINIYSPSNEDRQLI